MWRVVLVGPNSMFNAAYIFAYLYIYGPFGCSSNSPMRWSNQNVSPVLSLARRDCPGRRGHNVGNPFVAYVYIFFLIGAVAVTCSF